MRHHHERETAIGRHVTEELLQRLEAAGGSADAYDRERSRQGHRTLDHNGGGGGWRARGNARRFGAAS